MKFRLQAVAFQLRTVGNMICCMLTSYTVLIPLFTAERIDGALLRVWTVKHRSRYLRNLIMNHDHLHIADLSIWRTPKGVYLRNLIVKHRGKFILSPIGATTTEDTTAASQTMIQDLNTWILGLQTHAMTTPLGNRRVRKTTVIMVKQRAKNFTYSTTLTKFGLDPTTTTLQALRASFKELWVLKNIV